MTALLFLRLYERTGDTALLDLAADALRRDLAPLRHAAPSGALQVDEGWRTMPYLGAGSVGIGMVLDDYLAHRADDRVRTGARAEIVRAAQAKLLRPARAVPRRGGHGAAPEPHHRRRPRHRTTADLRRQIASLAWGAVPYQGHLAFAGEQMMRLSMDLSTGTAGLPARAGQRAARRDPCTCPSSRRYGGP